ncbi:MAG: AMP-binding protein [Clostridia bacterium]|nr:AMP-binding protein [Clostridia bacterium]
MNLKAPWLNGYGNVSHTLDYPDTTLSEQVLGIAAKKGDKTALVFMGRNISYSHMAKMIEKTAKAFAAAGVAKGDFVTLCMPNVPQTVYAFYALNMLGAVASMIHPLSAEGEILYYLQQTGSKVIVTLDQFVPKVLEVHREYALDKIIVADIADELSAVKGAAYRLISGRKNPKPAYNSTVVKWSDFLDSGSKYDGIYKSGMHKDDTAVILFSGGTTGVSKGIELSSFNFNALAYQTAEMSQCDVENCSMLAAMPMFHGFGLGVCVHTLLAIGGTSILVPRFNVEEYAKLIKKCRPNFIAGVPTLFEAIANSSYLDGVKLDCLRGVFSGGDSLAPDLKKKIDAFLESHGADVRVREGYGTTECVTASCLTPYLNEKEGSIGLPFPDTYYKICELGTTAEVEYGQLGEICISGPTVMKGYLNHEEETANTLETHEDGMLWLRTGDLGYMDNDGFVYFKQRIKRMIITSGYNVYPSQIESIFNAHEAVLLSCVIGVPDPRKIQKVKAYVILADGYEPTEELKEKLFEYCRRHIAKYAMPYDIEFRESLPKTKVGKIAYGELEKEAIEKEKEMVEA